MKKAKTRVGSAKRLFVIIVVTLTLLGSVGLVFSLTGNKTAKGSTPTIEKESNVNVLIPIENVGSRSEGKNFLSSNHFDTLDGVSAISGGGIEIGGDSSAEMGWANVQEIDGDSALNFAKNTGSITPLRIDGTTTDSNSYYTFETDFRFDGTTATETTKGDSSSWMVGIHLANNTMSSSYVNEKFFSLFFVGDLDSNRFFISSAHKMTTLENRYFMTEGFWYNLRVEYEPRYNYYRIYVNNILIESGYYQKDEVGADTSFAKAYVELRHYVPDVYLYLDNTYISVK